MAQTGLARAIHPVHTPLDGDVVFAVSTGRKPLTDPILGLTALGTLAAHCLARAVARGVYAANRPALPRCAAGLARPVRQWGGTRVSRGRLIFVGFTTAALLVLAGWQLQREWLTPGMPRRRRCLGREKLRPAQVPADPAARSTPVVRASASRVRLMQRLRSSRRPSTLA